MRKGERISYEWSIEISDIHGDIIENDFSYKVKDLAHYFPLQNNAELVLVRDLYTEAQGVIDRAWCYVDKKTMLLEPHFLNACDNIPTSSYDFILKFNS